MITLSVRVAHREVFDGPNGRAATMTFEVVSPGGIVAGTFQLPMEYIASRRFLDSRVYPLELDFTSGVPYPIEAAVAEEAVDVR